METFWILNQFDGQSWEPLGHFRDKPSAEKLADVAHISMVDAEEVLKNTVIHYNWGYKLHLSEREFDD